MTTGPDLPAPDRLLVPLDGSVFAERALPVALAFGERLDVAVDLIGVVDGEADVAQLRDRLATLAHESGGAIAATHVATDIDPVEPILALAARFAHPSVCLASHGRERVAGVLVDSVSTELLGASPSPVLVVGPNATTPPPDAPVVLCLDGWTASEVAVPVAVDWARRLGVPLVVTIVIDPAGDHVARRNRLPTDPAPFDPDDYVRAIAANCSADGVDARAHVIRYTSHPADGVAIYLGQHTTQLVVLATRAPVGLARVVSGSVASRIIHDSTAPVLVVGPGAGPDDVGATPGPAAARATTVPVASPTGAPFRTVIVPVDVDHVRTGELAVASALARTAAARLLLVAVEPGADERDAQRRLTDLADELRPGSVETVVLHSSDPALAIIELARSADDSIICMATHAPGLLTSAARGTIVGPLVRWSPVPLVLVGPDCALADGAYDGLAAFVDGSEVSDAVVALACRWARRLDLPLTIAEVVDPATRPAGGDTVQGAFVRRTAALAARRYAIATTAEAVDGARAAPAILAWATRHPNTVLVLGSHGRGSSEHALGAVVMDVSRHSVVPVVVWPAHA